MQHVAAPPPTWSRRLGPQEQRSHRMQDAFTQLAMKRLHMKTTQHHKFIFTRQKQPQIPNCQSSVSPNWLEMGGRHCHRVALLSPSSLSCSTGEACHRSENTGLCSTAELIGHFHPLKLKGGVLHTDRLLQASQVLPPSNHLLS